MSGDLKNGMLTVGQWLTSVSKGWGGGGGGGGRLRKDVNVHLYSAV